MAHGGVGGEWSKARPSPGSQVFTQVLARMVTAKRKKLGGGCQENVPTLIPAINHQLLGRQAPV